jgi:hypothetical protein
MNDVTILITKYDELGFGMIHAVPLPPSQQFVGLTSYIV